MRATTTSQFPDPFNGIELWTVRRKKKQLQNLSSLPQPIFEDAGVMIPGIVKNDDHLPLFPAHPEKSFQKSLKGICVERRCLHSHQLSHVDGDSAIKTYLLSCRRMQEDRILQLRGNPTCTPRTMLLKCRRWSYRDSKDLEISCCQATFIVSTSSKCNLLMVTSFKGCHDSTKIIYTQLYMTLL